MAEGANIGPQPNPPAACHCGNDLFPDRLIRSVHNLLCPCQCYGLLILPGGGYITTAASVSAQLPRYWQPVSSLQVLFPFARVVFIETDILLAYILIYLLIALDQLQQLFTLGWATIVELILGLALSAKFTTLSIIPAVIYIIFRRRRKGMSPKLPPASGWGPANSWVATP